jgi:hypothetical protein
MPTSNIAIFCVQLIIIKLNRYTTLLMINHCKKIVKEKTVKVGMRDLLMRRKLRTWKKLRLTRQHWLMMSLHWSKMFLIDN